MATTIRRIAVALLTRTGRQQINTAGRRAAIRWPTVSRARDSRSVGKAAISAAAAEATARARASSDRAGAGERVARRGAGAAIVRGSGGAGVAIVPAVAASRGV